MFLRDCLDGFAAAPPRTRSAAVGAGARYNFTLIFTVLRLFYDCSGTDLVLLSIVTNSRGGCRGLQRGSSSRFESGLVRKNQIYSGLFWAWFFLAREFPVGLWQCEEQGVSVTLPGAPIENAKLQLSLVTANFY